MDLKYEGLHRGYFKHKRNPGLIQQIKLEDFLPICKDRFRLVKSVSYALVNPIEVRLQKKEYKIAINSCVITDWKFKVVHPEIKKPKSLKDLVIIDIEILNNNSLSVFTKFEWFKDDLIHELNNYENK